MRKRLLVGAGILVVLAAIIVASVGRSGREKAIPVTIAEVKMGKIVGRVRGPGSVNPEAKVDISAHLPGKITRLAVREGQRVTRGELLLELDRNQYEAQAAEARASVEAQRSQVELARAQAEKAELDLRRAEDLHRRGLSSDQDLDLARTTARVEEARLGATKNQFEQVRAALQRAQDDLDKCRYTAPMDGIVSRLNVEEGEIAVTGTMNNPGTVLLSIADLSRMEVEAEIDETDVVDIRVGQSSRIKVDAFPDTSFAGAVTEIGNTAVTRNRGTQEETTYFLVQVVVQDSIPGLRPGMTATVEVETAVRDSAVRVPIQAVVARNLERERRNLQRNRDPSRRKRDAAHAAEADTADADDDDEAHERRIDGVYVVQDERAVFVPVHTGISDERFLEARTGLAAGDRVVTGPYQTLRTLESGKRVQEKKDERKSGRSRS